MSADERSVPLEPTVTVVTPSHEKSQEDIPPIPEYTLREEVEQSRTYRFVSVGGEETNVNMAIVQPYRKILQHAGKIHYFNLWPQCPIRLLGIGELCWHNFKNNL